MAHYLLLIYLTCLASVAVQVSAQSCNTTGMFDDCCPSLDNKVITVKGKEFRVHCDLYIGQKANRTTTSVECLDSCSSDPGCIGVHLKRPANARSTICERKLQYPEPKTVSFVLVDPTDTTQLINDLGDCRNNLTIITASNATCTTALGKCRDDLDNCKPGDTTCPGKLVTCDKQKGKCEEALERYKKQGKAFCCNETKVQEIGGRKYRHHCNQVTTPASPNPFSSQKKAENMEECARLCTKTSGCRWLYYVAHTKNCALGRGGWNHQTKNAFTTPGAQGPGCSLLERV